MLAAFLQHVDWTEVLLFLLPSAAGTLLVWYRKRLLVWKRMWHRVFDGLTRIPEMESTLKGISKYVEPSGQGSLVELANRTEEAVIELTERVDMVVQTMFAENDSDDYVARFYCNSDGENTYVNQTYARWLGVGKSELLGWKFFNFVHPDDVDMVRAYWETCRAEHRRCQIRFRFSTVTGEALYVEAIATPIPESAPAKRWIGTIRRLDRDRRKTD